jgi:hypothetical protein
LKSMHLLRAGTMQATQGIWLSFPFVCIPCKLVCRKYLLLVENLFTLNSQVITILFQKIMREDSKCKTVLKYTSHCQSYIEKCLKLCYFAAVQDPPMYLDFSNSLSYNAFV